MRYPVMVFDFDGTLADSYAEGVAIFQRIGPELGITILEGNELEAARALPTRQFLKKVGVSLWKLPRVIRAYQAAAAETAHTLKLFAGIFESLNQLHADGVRLGILSSNREDTIRTCLRANDVEHLFEFVIGYPKLFGKGRALRRLMKERQIARTDLLYIGDESRDVIAARKARVEIAAVAWGFQTESILRETGATTVLHKPEQLLDVVPTHQMGI